MPKKRKPNLKKETSALFHNAFKIHKRVVIKWAKTLSGKTACDTCGKEYNNYLAIFGKEGVPLARLCNDCLFNFREH